MRASATPISTEGHELPHFGSITRKCEEPRNAWPSVLMECGVTRRMRILGPRESASGEHIRIRRARGWGSGAEQHLDGPALVHGAVALGDVVEAELDVEHRRGVERARDDVGE